MFRMKRKIFRRAGSPPEKSSLPEADCLNCRLPVCGQRPIIRFCFLNSLRQSSNGRAPKDQEVPESQFPAPSVEEIKAAVCAAYGTKKEELYGLNPGIRNEPRDVSVYLVRTLCGETLPAIAGLTGIKTYSTVSSTLGGVIKQLAEDSAFRKKVERLKNGLTQSQRQI